MMQIGLILRPASRGASMSHRLPRTGRDSTEDETMLTTNPSVAMSAGLPTAALRAFARLVRHNEASAASAFRRPKSLRRLRILPGENKNAFLTKRTHGPRTSLESVVCAAMLALI